MGLFDQFPYTNFHELNLDWVLQTIKDMKNTYDVLQKEIQDTIDFVNNFEKHADELIDERISIQLSIYDQRIKDLQNQIDKLYEEINKDDGVLGMLEAMGLRIDDLQNQINNLQHTLNDEVFKLLNMLHEYKHSIDAILAKETDRLEKYIYDTVTKLDRLDVVNPITGIFEDIQNVLDDIVAIVSNSYGITALQYDSLGLTAMDYDRLFITAEEYSTKGYFQLYQKLSFAIVRNPFTGLNDSFQNVLNSLTELHKCFITALEYDNKQLTAEDYDKMRLTAFAYDWFGSLVVNFITAELYDKLELEADAYDKLEITASEYDRGMVVLTNMCMRGCKTTCGDYALLASQITDLQAEISKLEETISELEGEESRVEYGTTWAGFLRPGQLQEFVPIPTVNIKSEVTINSDFVEQPNTIVIMPYKGVALRWQENNETVQRGFTVRVADKY